MGSDLSLILIAHGSKDPLWQKSFEELNQKLKKDFSKDKINLAFMDLNSPDLDAIILKLYKTGKKKFKVLPMFMASGRHMEQDIPRQINQIKEKYVEVEIELLKPIGEHPYFYSLLKQIINEC
ncbi:MAG: hypothetical protein A3B68_08940 [Candidatus Melainabacteria bacterium RIFCSPHIGHO2_02_FULL_34_12]|nr:MAG: hypothetical protein A3B68_08940 [Candidatus Melainabacteria bacterium RIFCSPHIGHO2_02_FULL_34_12]